MERTILNKCNLYGDVYIRKFNFLKQFKLNNEKFIENMRYLENIKSLHFKLSEASSLILGNGIFVKNRGDALFNNKNINPQRYNSLSFNNEYYPRVYLFCLNLCSDYKNISQEDYLFKLLYDYEDKVKLTLKELWSIPFFLEYVIVNNIYDISNRIYKIEMDRYKGYNVFNKVIKLINKGKLKINKSFISHIFTNDISTYTIDTFISLIREKNIKNSGLEILIDKLLENEELPYDKIISKNKEDLDNLRIDLSRYISVLKNISLYNFKERLEEISSIHREFLKDPSKVYGNMDYESRDFYRKSLERICKLYGLNEYEEAVNIVDLSKKGSSNYSRHIGYYLLDKGNERFKKLKRRKRFKKISYFSSIFLSISLFQIGIIYFLLNTFGNIYISLLVSIPFLFIIGDILIGIINHVFIKVIDKKFTPKMDYVNNIPSFAKTMVIIPSLLNDKEDLKNIIKNLELSYLCNRDGNLYFSLLLDYKDTISYDKYEDKNLLDYGRALIDNLNNKYKEDYPYDRFYLFIRDKVYSESNKVYMGWERKRGKIMEFIKFLKGRESNFHDSIDNYKHLKDVKYLISIDSDTKLIKNSAFKLIGAIDHVLNKALVKSIKGYNKVIRGYGIVQPKVTVSFKSSLNTFYSKVFCGNTQISSYNLLSGDIYRDIFSEGIFIGKGIIDIDVFDKIMWDVIPENRVLSHDLIEGCFSKVCVASDIELKEDFPSSILSNFMRIHRWVRGDFQLIPYLFKGRGINLLGKYKILDNLRRSLVPISYFIVLIMPFIFSSYNMNLYFGVVVLSILFPFLIDVSSLNISGITKDSIYYRLNNLIDRFIQGFIMFSFIPYYAYITFDAIVKVIIRLFITKQYLLEWKSFSEVEKTIEDSLFSYVRSMIITLFIGVIFVFSSFRLSVYEMIIPSFIFCISPIIAYAISIKYLFDDKLNISLNKDIFLRSLSRSIYAYFEDFVTESTNYLVCDNYQEDPFIGIAKKTSPTNIGMSLNAFVLSRDFGFITILDMIDKVTNILDSIDTLPTYRGHLYNWYDIEKRVTLGNEYVSTVDSGNLLSSYYLCAESLDNILDSTIIHKDLLRDFEGLSYLSNGFKGESSYRDIIESGFEYKEYLDYIKLLEDLIKESDKNISDLRKNGEDVYWHIKINESSNSFLNEIREITCNIHEVSSFNVNKFGEIFINTPIKILDEALIEFKKSYNNSSVRSEYIDKKISDIIDNIKGIKLSINKLIERIYEKIHLMDFKFLYNERKELLSIGYNCENDSLDDNCYDLLASEARMASFLSVAKGDVPAEHWFKLSRIGVKEGKFKTLLSWSGTMFEYLMPMLYMKSYKGTLLYNTYKGCVSSQINYGKHKNVPFGISESCFYEMDSNLNYQYKAFGDPNLSIQKDYDNLIISPYSSIMSLCVDFKNSIKNLYRLTKMGVLGKYGFYESLDFTSKGVSKENPYLIVKNYMAHHQGMSFMALSNILMDNICQKRFGNIPEVESVDDLLNESVMNIVLKKVSKESYTGLYLRLQNEFIPRIIKYKNDVKGTTQILSNGEYFLFLSSSGGAYLKYKDKYISDKSRDITSEGLWGSIYINDLEKEDLFSSTYLPCKNINVDYVCEFNSDRVKFIAKNKSLNVTTEVIVPNEDNIEIRKIILKNLTSHNKSIEIASYLDSNVINSFVSYDRNKNISICKNKDEDLFIGHSVYINSKNVTTEFECRKEEFIGKNGIIDDPSIFKSKGSYGNYFSYDQIDMMSLFNSVELGPYEHISLYYMVCLGEKEEYVINTLNKYNSLGTINNVFSNNIYNVEFLLSSLSISPLELSFFNYITSFILYGHGEINEFNYKLNVKDLISHNIDQSIPIVSIEVDSVDDLNNLEILIKAYRYFYLNGLNFNLIILNSYTKYDKKMKDSLDDIILKYNLKDRINVDNGIYVISSNLYKSAYEIVKSISNIHILKGGKSIYDQLGFKTEDQGDVLEDKRINTININKKEGRKFNTKVFNRYLLEVSEEIYSNDYINKYDMPKKSLKYYNSYGGFDKNDYTYVMRINDLNITPNYYKNVLSNKYITSLISSKGFLTTSCFYNNEFSLTEGLGKDNYEFKGECIYLREGNEVWSPSLSPISNGEDYMLSTSPNYVSIKNSYRDLVSKVKYFIPEGKKYKVTKITLKNLSDNDRNLSLCYFAPLSLEAKGDYSKRLSTYINKDFDYIYGENILSKEFRNIKAYLKLFGCDKVSFTGSKREFLGINVGYFNPPGMFKRELSNLCGIFSESSLCALGDITLSPNEVKDVYAVLGYDDNIESINDEIRSLSNKCLFDCMEEELDRDKSNYIKIKTQDESLDIFINTWILHQNNIEKFILSSSDKGKLNSIVDIMEECLIYNYIDRDISKKNIIKVFSNMYEDGTFKDKWSVLTKEYEVNNSFYDSLWVLYILIDYINVTGDMSILSLDINFTYNNDNKIKSSTIYEKCLKIINRCIGTEAYIYRDKHDTSVLFMLHKVLNGFRSIALNYNDNALVKIIDSISLELEDFLERKCFNGEFYLNNIKDIYKDEERYKIYLLPQVLSLSVISKTSHKVIRSIDKYLVNKDVGFLREYFNKCTNISDEYDSVQNNKILLLLIKELFNLNLPDIAYKYLGFINPVLKTTTRNDVNSYKYEPYMVPYKILYKRNYLNGILNEDFKHVSSLFYRIVIEDLIGLKISKEGFYISPNIPSNWKSYSLDYKRDGKRYKLIVRRGDIKQIKVNGEKYEDNIIKFMDNTIDIIDLTI